MPRVVDVQGGTNVLRPLRPNRLRSFLLAIQPVIACLLAAMILSYSRAAEAGDAVLIEFASSRCRPCQQMKLYWTR